MSKAHHLESWPEWLWAKTRSRRSNVGVHQPRFVTYLRVC